MDKKVAMEEISKTARPPRKKKEPVAKPASEPRLDTEALLVKELLRGMHYQCLLADRRVQYIGGNQIKWHSQETDEYRISEVHDYQLKPLDHKGGATGLEGI